MVVGSSTIESVHLGGVSTAVDGRPPGSEPTSTRPSYESDSADGRYSWWPTTRAGLSIRDTLLPHACLIGAGFIDHGLVFCRPDGTPLHPERFSRTFAGRAARADLPPTRLLSRPVFPVSEGRLAH
jgi:hypothetical protein